ncbi:MAG: hypothetical protein L0387_45385 [Acidobacteria bacterium]|nr:hypothetical protein [Acidobacteriota bacterium]
MDQTTEFVPSLPAGAMMLPLLLGIAMLAAGGLLALGYWIRKLAGKLASQQQKVEQLENRLRTTVPEQPGQWQASVGKGSKERYKVLYLNSLGYSAPEIAKEARLRVAEVNFILRVDAQAATAKSL